MFGVQRFKNANSIFCDLNFRLSLASWSGTQLRESDPWKMQSTNQVFNNNNNSNKNNTNRSNNNSYNNNKNNLATIIISYLAPSFYSFQFWESSFLFTEVACCQLSEMNFRLNYQFEKRIQIQKSIYESITT